MKTTIFSNRRIQTMTIRVVGADGKVREEFRNIKGDFDQMMMEFVNAIHQGHQNFQKRKAKKSRRVSSSLKFAAELYALKDSR